MPIEKPKNENELSNEVVAFDNEDYELTSFPSFKEFYKYYKAYNQMVNADDEIHDLYILPLERTALNAKDIFVED